MIHRSKGLLSLIQDLMPRLDFAHQTGTGWVRRLRDGSMDVYSGGPMPEPDPVNPRKRCNVAEWVMHFTTEPVRLAAIRENVITRDSENVVTGDAFVRLFPEQVESEAGYHVSAPVLVGLIQAVVDAHGGRVELLTTRERNELADAIERELEP